MEKQKLLDYVAPCSLFCYTCPGLKGGAIADCAGRLCRYFEGYYEFSDKNIPAEYRAWLPKLKEFQEQLEGYTKANCPGCRNNPTPGDGCVAGCVVPGCVIEHEVDYCAECAEFPCEKAASFFDTVNDGIRKDWLAGSNRLREVGIERYFEEKKDISHYIRYKM